MEKLLMVRIDERIKKVRVLCKFRSFLKFQISFMMASFLLIEKRFDWKNANKLRFLSGKLGKLVIWRQLFFRK